MARPTSLSVILLSRPSYLGKHGVRVLWKLLSACAPTLHILLLQFRTRRGTRLDVRSLHFPSLTTLVTNLPHGAVRRLFVNGALSMLQELVLGSCGGRRCGFADLRPQVCRISRISAPALCAAYGAAALQARTVELVGDDSCRQRRGALHVLGENTSSTVRNLSVEYSRGDSRILRHLLVGAGNIVTSLRELRLVERYSESAVRGVLLI